MSKHDEQERNGHDRTQILVVDDADAIRVFLRVVLQAEGFVVYQAASGSEALSVLAEAPIDMMTLDLGLPDYDGLDLLAEVRTSHPYLPVLVLSVRNDRHSRHKAKQLGAQHYLRKPFDYHELLPILHAMRSEERTHRE